MQKGIFYNAKGRLLQCKRAPIEKPTTNSFYNLWFSLRLTDGGQCWFHNRQRGACKSSERNGERNRLFGRAAAAKDSKILFIPNIFLSLHLDYRTH